MKKIVISSVVTALLVFSGCSSKSPIVDETSKQEKEKQEVADVETETVSADNVSVVDENKMSGSDSNEMSMANVEAKMKTIYFDFDKFFIRDDMKNNVTTDAELANGDASAYVIKLEGNCDEWGSDEYNFALGLKRANSVKKSLAAEGVDTERMTMVSYGESNPVCKEKTKECWSKNRRVDFKLLP